MAAEERVDSIKRARITILRHSEYASASSIAAIEHLFTRMTAVQTSVKIVDIDRFQSRQLGDVVVIPGGEPKKLFSALGKNGRTALKAYLERGGKLLGICAGACVLYDMNLFPQCVETVNDNRWANSGIAAGVKCELMSDVTPPLVGRAHYENGPLFRLRLKKKQQTHTSDLVVRSVYISDAVKIHLKRIAAVQTRVPPNHWVCNSCIAAVTENRSKCSYCGEKKNFKLPPTEEMPNTIAALRQGSNIYAVSFHLEFSDDTVMTWFQSELELFLEGTS